MAAEGHGIDLDAALAGRKVVALFHATWCPFCRTFVPVFRRHVGGGAYEPLEVVLDDEQDPLWTRFNIDVVPTVIFFDDGKLKDRLDGQLGVGIDERTFRRVLERAP